MADLINSGGAIVEVCGAPYDNIRLTSERCTRTDIPDFHGQIDILLTG
jgi:hypothetical protein